MLPTGIVLIVLGLAAAVGCFFWKRSSVKSSGWWSSVAELDVAAALKQPDGSAVAVAGATAAPLTEAGPALTDPVHGQQCCWWRETVTEHWEERVRVNRSANDNGPDHRWEDRSNEVSNRTSGLPFLLTDGAQISVDLHDIDIDDKLLHEQKTQQRQGDGEGIAEAIVDSLLSTGYQRDEYTETRLQTLPPGTRVLVAGRTTDGRIIADVEHGLQVTQGTVASRLGKSQKGAQRAHLGLLAGSGLAVLGVVVAIAGAATA
ncbi:MAG: hypothetical protein JWM31_2123 [Solirubrobacterales bacterium]|nr:hypothetical protein [Solirubrobacterales bacterium]